MKTIFKLIVLLMAATAMFLAGCSDKEPDKEIPEEAYEIVGTWTGKYHNRSVVMKFSKDGYVHIDINENSENGTWKYNSNNRGWNISATGYFEDHASISGLYYIIGDELFHNFHSDLVLKKNGGSDDDNEGGIYAGKDFVGKWQGTDESDEFLIELEADGTYTDWLVQNGSAKYEKSGKYTVSGSTLTPPSNSNLVSTWGNKPYTFKFSGKNKMTITNKLMNDYNQELVLFRK